MKLYWSVIITAMVTVSAVNILCAIDTWQFVVFATVWSTALQFVLDGIIALIINKLPLRWFTDGAVFSVSEWEKQLYQRVQVKRWKDKVWELGGLGGFSKKHLTAPTDLQHIETFITECNKGVITHRLSYPVGFFAMSTLPGVSAFTIALPVACVNLFLNILPTVVLRYNTPKLKKIQNRLKGRELCEKTI